MRLQQRQYRIQVTSEQSTFNQPPHPSFYVGTGMADPPKPDIYVRRAATGT